MGENSSNSSLLARKLGKEAWCSPTPLPTVLFMQQTTETPPVHLPLPTPEPSPRPGCAACLSITVRRQNARSAGNYSEASDANVVLRTHLSEDHQ